MTMPTTSIGVTFPASSQWHQDEIDLIDQLKWQIDQTFGDQSNLLINTTWFGPQFDNGAYQQFLNTVEQRRFHNLFLVAAADPVFLNHEQLQDVANRAGVRQVYRCGHFDGLHQFNFHSFVIPKYFETYTLQDLAMTTPDFVYCCYNRKPRPHRIDLVRKILHNDLQHRAIITLGRNDPTYSQLSENDLYMTLGERPEDYAGAGNWNLPMNFGIPHDIHSLGNMDLWRRHFLHVVNETEFWPWDNLFVSEKTWKPIIGLRPFVVNGQSQVYAWLRKHGFRTFERYWPDIDCENVNETQVHDSIVRVIQRFYDCNTKTLSDCYRDMMPDLVHNRDRFFEFSREQYHKSRNLFQI